MARNRSKRSKPHQQEPIHTSTATIFQNLKDELEEEQEEEQQQRQPTKKEQSQVASQFTSKEDIENATFPFNYIYQFQDFLNERMTLLKAIQLAIMLFYTQLLYLHKDKIPGLYERISEIFFNWLGIVFCLILEIVRSKEDKINPPDFNYFYSILIPTFLNLLHYDPQWFIANLSLNYFILDRLNPIFNIISSIMFFEIYKPENSNLSTIQFIQLCIFQLFFNYIINYINEGNITTEVTKKEGELIENLDYNKTLKKSEIQLICILIVNLLFNQSLMDNYLPITIFQKLFISLVISSILLYPLFQIIPQLISILLFGSIFSYLTIFQLNHILKENAIKWLYEYIISDDKRLYILKVWIVMASITIPIVFYFVEFFTLNIRRKIWHLFIIVALTFSPSILYSQIEFTLISLLGMLAIFLIIEVLRYNQISFIGKYLFNKLIKFQDFKDLKGPLNLSYIYLLVGVTIPIIYDFMINKQNVTIIRYAGLVTLGVGDTLASIIGRRYGSIKWKGSDKSIQGTIAFISSSLVAFYLIDEYSKFNIYLPVSNWENLFVTVLLAGLLEGTADINDNYLIPIFIPISYEILNKCYP
ncbi:unnamed protein product [Candida verbasci]|uniref:dolichol kinase n=1 Tax=Candida verbasci TaxID=1227364 RepID=A0A9W4TXZ5_9ASCO|nr:unnamed protein product [Candida verbasci]